MKPESKKLIIAAAVVALILSASGAPAGRPATRPAAEKSPTKATGRAKLLKQHVDKFALTLKHINPHGPDIRLVVRLTVAEMGGRVPT